MPEPHVQVLLLCRWSVPASLEAFEHKFSSMDELRTHLYAPERLRLRLWMLRNVLIPSIRSQNDDRFKLLLMLGEHLPSPYREAVLESVSSVPQIRPIFVPEGQPHREQCRELMQRFRDPRATVVAEGRLDDDDALATDFVAMARSYFPKLRPFFRNAPKLALDFPRGFLFEIRGAELTLQPAIHRLWTPALIIYTRPSHPKGLLDYKHHLLWQHMDVYSWQDQPMFLRGVHSGNDSGISFGQGRDTGRTYSDDEIDAQLFHRFGINLTDLQESWANFVASGAC
ncbi:MAG: hypothetical protein JJ872_14205 [Marivivens sp.]|nr:hypothetical protein [Marivivens sp.]